jgi:6-pyruvoyltetrahydropterin/6-carboxytetrahydropterin synthase
LRIEERAGNIVAHFNGEELHFLKQDVMLLPLANITVEELSQYFLEQLLQFCTERGESEIHAFVVKVFTGPGQGASANWQRETTG